MSEIREIRARAGAPEAGELDLVAVPLAPEAARGGEELRAGDPRLDPAAAAALRRMLTAGAFRAEAGETRVVAAGAEGRPDLLAVGTGDSDPASPIALRRAAGVAMRAARRQRARRLGFVLPDAGPEDGGREDWAERVQAAVEGLALGDWSYDALRGEAARERRPPPPEAAVLLLAEAAPPTAALEPALARGRILAEVQNRTRDLVAQPGNVVTPRHLANVAEGLAERWGLRAQAWGPEKLRSEGLGALLAVSRGSVEEPRFVIVEHAGAEGPPVALVGKGVTFDSGGISIKPSSGMESMKYDMAGAAAVLGALEAAARLEVPRRVVGLIPATENLPSGSALKPGDVIRGLSGRSIEVVNTDAEGRLILSDALTFARRLEPRAIVDLATLTGGCVVALGHHAIGLMSPDDALATALEAAGERVDERAWRLPLWTEYRKQLDSEIADLKNTGGREASPITAGWFLRTFVEGTSWAHLDIAGTAWSEEERGWQPKGATGVGVRLLLEWLRHES